MASEKANVTQSKRKLKELGAISSSLRGLGGLVMVAVLLVSSQIVKSLVMVLNCIVNKE